MELIVVMAIIAILVIALYGVNFLASVERSRFTKVYGDMKAIADAAELYNQDTGSYAVDAGAGADPAFVSGTPKYLQKWPTPPCTGWTYDWENLSSGAIIKVTLRKGSTSTSTPVYHYCIVTTTANCNTVGPPADNKDIRDETDKRLKCE